MVAWAMKAKFRLGKVVATPGTIEALAKSGDDPLDLLKRHQSGDWGDLCGEDKGLNDEAVAHEGDPVQQGRVLSAYKLKDGIKVWVITEADRSSTCLLLPDEY